MPQFHGFDAPNYTTVPNQFFDNVLKDIKELGELKVTLIALRETFGYHRPDAELAVGFFVLVGGMTINTVRRGLKQAIRRGTLFKVRNSTNREGAWYRVRMSDDVKEKLATWGSTADPPKKSRGSTAATLGGQRLTPLKKQNKAPFYNKKERKPLMQGKFADLVRAKGRT